MIDPKKCICDYNENGSHSLACMNWNTPKGLFNIPEEGLDAIVVDQIMGEVVTSDDANPILVSGQGYAISDLPRTVEPVQMNKLDLMMLEEQYRAIRPLLRRLRAEEKLTQEQYDHAINRLITLFPDGYVPTDV